MTALEAQSKNVPKWAVVTERLLHELSEKTPMHSPGEEGRKALFAKQRSGQKRQFTCHFCHKPGHFGKTAGNPLHHRSKTQKLLRNKKAMEKFFRCVSGIITVSKGGWIVDSGATCHMCNDESQFIQLKRLRTIQEVRLGNGRPLDGTAEGTIRLETLLPDGKTKNFTVENVLFVPKLSYNLLSVSNAGRDRGKQA